MTNAEKKEYYYLLVYWDEDEILVFDTLEEAKKEAGQYKCFWEIIKGIEVLNSND